MNEKIDKLLENLDSAHNAYYESGIFGGPSLYFHKEALEAATAGEFERFSEMTYAMLASWGMHRMGRGGAKMREFSEFQESLNQVWPLVLSLQKLTPAGLNDASWKKLRQIFCGIHCMATGTSLVGNSKVMAHALPNLIPPIDREYTLRFLRGNGNIRNGIDREWSTLRLLLEEFFYPISQDDRFREDADQWMRQKKEFPWDTSSLKVVDNLIIGFMTNNQEL